MAESQKVQCVKRCRDNKTGLRYHIGNTGDIDPSQPIAMYFKGFAPGTKVYHEIKGTKPKFDGNGNKLSDGTPIKVTTITVPGETIDVGDLDEEPALFECNICGRKDLKSQHGLDIHMKSCQKKLDEQLS